MPGTAGNPVLAPIRRWVLYSRTHLALTVTALFATLLALGMLLGRSPSPATHSAAKATTSAATGMSQPISYELVEVGEAWISDRAPSWVTSSAPATAMAYLHTYIDQSLSQDDWLSALSHYTATAPGQSFTAARPRGPVAITGTTRSRLTAGPADSRTAQVSIPTPIGPVQITVAVTPSGDGPRWRVADPLPTLDTSKITPSTPSTGPDTTPATPSSTAPAIPAPGAATPSPAPSPTRIPPTGPIPAPDLNTPLPGNS